MRKRILAIVMAAIILTGCGAKEAQPSVQPGNEKEKEVQQTDTVSVPTEEEPEETVSTGSEEEADVGETSEEGAFVGEIPDEEPELAVMAANEAIIGNMANQNRKDNLKYYPTTSDRTLPVCIQVNM